MLEKTWKWRVWGDHLQTSVYFHHLLISLHCRLLGCLGVTFLLADQIFLCSVLICALNPTICAILCFRIDIMYNNIHCWLEVILELKVILMGSLVLYGLFAVQSLTFFSFLASCQTVTIMPQALVQLSYDLALLSFSVCWFLCWCQSSSVASLLLLPAHLSAVITIVLVSRPLGQTAPAGIDRWGQPVGPHPGCVSQH